MTSMLQVALTKALQYLSRCDLTVPLTDQPDRAIAMATVLQITLTHHGFTKPDQVAVVESLLTCLQYEAEVKQTKVLFSEDEMVQRMKNTIIMSGASTRRVM